MQQITMADNPIAVSTTVLQTQVTIYATYNAHNDHPTTATILAAIED